MKNKPIQKAIIPIIENIPAIIINNKTGKKLFKILEQLNLRASIKFKFLKSTNGIAINVSIDMA